MPGWANTIWLTDQDRVDSDRAAFGEISFDVTPKFTITGGLRYYSYDNRSTDSMATAKPMET